MFVYFPIFAVNYFNLGKFVPGTDPVRFPVNYYIWKTLKLDFC